MEHPANDENINAGCSNIKRLRTSAEQNDKIARKPIDFDDETYETASAQRKSIASNVRTGSDTLKNMEIGTRSKETPASVSGNSLETINDDCLRAIFRYLDIMDIVNLARTSQRMLAFSNEITFPKEVKKIGIYWYYDRYHGNCEKISLHTSGGWSQELTRAELQTAFRYFAEFVVDLTFDTVDRTPFNNTYITWNILASCHNLQKLHLKSYIFSPEAAQELQNHIERFQHLNELTITDCRGIVTYWRAFKGILNVTKLTLDRTYDNANGHFIGSFLKLTSLTLDLTDTHLQCADFVEMFDNNRHSLKHLKVRNITENSTPEKVISLLADRLRNFEYLELEFDSSDGTTSLINLPHLKSIKLTFLDEECINAALQTLSDNGIVEVLRIYGGVFHEGAANAQPPLNFPKLRTITWSSWRFSGILQTFTRSHMPEIEAIDICDISSIAIDDLCELIESKNTLKTIKFNGFGDMIPLSFWHRLIATLNEPPTRPLLRFFLNTYNLKENVVSKITFQH